MSQTGWRPSLLLRPDAIASRLWRRSGSQSISKQVLRWIAAVTLGVCMVLQPLRASLGQAFTPDPSRSKPEPIYARYDCSPFFPRSDQHLAEINTVRTSLENKYGSGEAYWQGIRSQQDLLNRLQEGLAPVPITHGQVILPISLVLYMHCRMLNDSKMRPSKSYIFLEWLEDQYEQISKTGRPTNDASDGTCAMDAPLPQSAIEMWLAWNIFNNRLYGISEDLATGVENATSAGARDMERKLGPVPMPQRGPNYETEKCEVLRHGPLNDAAAAAWVEAMSFYCTHQDESAGPVFDRLKSQYSKAWVYNPSEESFWAPADPGAIKKCP